MLNGKQRERVCVLLPVIHSHPQRADEILITRELGRYNGKNVPVVLFHDRKHEKGLLLQRRAELEESGLLVLQRHSREPPENQHSFKVTQSGADRSQA